MAGKTKTDATEALKQVTYLAFKQQAQLLYGFQIHFLGCLFVEQSHRCATEPCFSGYVGNTHLVFAHHAGKMAADHG